MSTLRGFALIATFAMGGCGATPAVSDAPPTAGVLVDGEVGSARSFSAADLGALGTETVTATGEHSGPHAYRGVPLGKLLTAAGFSPGPKGRDVPKDEKRSGWKRAIVATAADGYQTVFSCAEVADGMGATRAFVVFERDGESLPADEGPMRLVVPSDAEGSRSVHQLVRLTIVDARRALAGAAAVNASPR